MEEGMKKCPFCGAEIKEDAKKCRFCNNWIPEEIACPFCAEKIKANAKKCRFCGEWLDTKDEEKKSQKVNFNFNPKVLLISLAIVLLGATLFLFIYGFFIYTPSCSSNKVQEQFSEYLMEKYPSIKNVTVDQDKIEVVSKNNGGYTCKASAQADNAPFNIEFSYKKLSFNKFNFDSKIILPDCYDSTMLNLLADLIKKSSYKGIKDLASDVEIENSQITKFDENIPSYKCQGQAIITAKPGQAFVLNFWDSIDAQRKIQCEVEYKNTFCGNGYTSCVALNDISNCRYYED